MHTINVSHSTHSQNISILSNQGLLPTSEKMVVCFRREEDHKSCAKTNYQNLNIKQLFDLNNTIIKRPDPITFKDIRKINGSIRRFRVFNNNFFSNVEDLKYSSFSAQQESKEVHLRLQRLTDQIKFATKYRCLTFKLSLQAVKNKKLIIGKGKTIMQGSYYGTNPNSRVGRSKSEAPQKIKKSFNECHISCIPNIYEHSKISNIIDLFISSLESDQGLDIDAFIKDHFQDNKYKQTIEIALKLYSFLLKDQEGFISARNDLFLKMLHKDNQSITAKPIEKFLLNIKKEDLQKLNQPEYASIKEYRDLVIKRNQTIKKKEALKKEDQTDDITREIEGLIDEIKDYQDQLKEKQNLYVPLMHLFMNNFESFSSYKNLFKNEDLLLIREFHQLTPSSNQSKESLLYTISALGLSESFGMSESIVPLNSILGLMLNATLSMPSEINKGIDAATDKTHKEVAKLLTEFSHIENPTEQDLDTYMTKYIDLLKTAYTDYKNANALNGTVPQSQLEELIGKIQGVSMEIFLSKYKASVTNYYIEHLKYDAAFEKSLTGQITTDASDLIKPLVEFQSCKTCTPLKNKKIMK